MFDYTGWGMTLKIWEATTWIRIASLNISKDTAPWIASWVVQLIRTHETTSIHMLLWLTLCVLNVNACYF